MSDVHTIERMLVAYLHQHHLLGAAVDCETDLIESGQLDSLVVMDLVGFVASTFGIRMSPQEITPENLRSVQRLAQFVAAHSRVSDKAA
jgi:acyl carrier protein